GSVADRDGSVSVGTTVSQRQMVNVAAGTQGTDAVNLDQLQATLATANAYTDTAVATGGTAANAYTDNRDVAIRADMEAGDTAAVDAANDYTDTRETAIRSDLDAGDAATLSAANSYTDTRIADLVGFDPGALNGRMDALEDSFADLDGRLHRQDRRIDRQGAMGAAMLNMAINAAGSNSPRGRIAVGAGFNGGEQALSIGYGKR